MLLLDYLRSDLVPLMKRRDKVALRAVRDAIGAIENAGVSYLATPALVGAPSDFVAGGVRFGCAERVVRELSDPEMMAIARGQVDDRLAESARFREVGRIDQALTLKAEALALADRLDAYPSAA